MLVGFVQACQAYVDVRQIAALRRRFGVPADVLLR